MKTLSYIFIPKKSFFGKTFATTDELFFIHQEDKTNEEMTVVKVNCSSLEKARELIITYAEKYKKKRPTEQNIKKGVLFSICASYLQKEPNGTPISYNARDCLLNIGYKVTNKNALYIQTPGGTLQKAIEQLKQEMIKNST